MREIKKLLERWERFVPSEKSVRRVLPEIIKKQTGATISPEHIATRNDIIFIKTSSLIKAEVFLKKIKILSDLRSVLGDKTPRDIR